MLKKILSLLNNNKGAAMLEFAIIAPVFMIIFVLGTAQFGFVMNRTTGLKAVVREAGRWAMVTTGGQYNMSDKAKEKASEFASKVLSWNTNIFKPQSDDLKVIFDASENFTVNGDTGMPFKDSGPEFGCTNNECKPGDIIGIVGKVRIPWFMPIVPPGINIENNQIELWQATKIRVEDV